MTSAAETLGRLRDLVRKNEHQRRVEDLRGVIGEAVALAVTAAAGTDLKVDVRLHPAAAIACIDKVQIEQVLMNLARNAIEAMADTPRPIIVVETAPAPNDKIAISVVDNGPGIPRAVKEKLFRPFVTTKRDGMGVALSICRLIVEAHGGRLWAEDHPGSGAAFRFTVPHAPPTGTTVPPGECLPKPARGDKKSARSLAR